MPAAGIRPGEKLRHRYDFELFSPDAMTFRQLAMVAGRIGHRDSMQLKHAIAAALSLFLLCASSLASACELSCSLTSSHPISRPVSSPKNSSTVPANEAAASASMSHSHCGHSTSARPGNAVGLHCEDASTCGSAPCAQAPALLSPVSIKNSAQVEGSHLAVIVAIVSPAGAISNSSDTIKLQPAPPKLLLLDPLSVALRI
jgi:hypothetical protein